MQDFDDNAKREETEVWKAAEETLKEEAQKLEVTAEEAVKEAEQKLEVTAEEAVKEAEQKLEVTAEEAVKEAEQKLEEVSADALQQEGVIENAWNAEASKGWEPVQEAYAQQWEEAQKAQTEKWQEAQKAQAEQYTQQWQETQKQAEPYQPYSQPRQYNYQPQYNEQQYNAQSPYSGQQQYNGNSQSQYSGQQPVYRQDPDPQEPKKPKKKGAALRVACIVLAICLVATGIGYAVSGLVTAVANQTKVEQPAETESETRAGRRNHPSEESPTDSTQEATPSKADTVQPTAEAAKPTPGETAVDAVHTSEKGANDLLSVADIVEEVLPSVVTIQNTAIVNSRYYGSYESVSEGSGIIIGDNGSELWIATNYHVVEDNDKLEVTFCDGESVAAYVKGSSNEDDLAVIGVDIASMKASTLEAIRTAVMGDSDALRLGEGVIAIGNALGWGQSVTTGVISALNREVSFDDGNTMYLLQVSAAINPGNSGGALLNSKGELIGINNAKYSDTDVEGIGFAIPISSVKELLEEFSLMEARKPVSADEYPYLGIVMSNMSSAYMQAYGFPTGARISEVGEDTPAAKGGLLKFDIITKLNGVKISSYEDVAEEMQYIKGGTTVEITVMRLNNGKYEEVNLQVTLGFKKDYQNN